VSATSEFSNTDGKSIIIFYTQCFSNKYLFSALLKTWSVSLMIETIQGMVPDISIAEANFIFPLLSVDMSNSSSIISSPLAF